MRTRSDVVKDMADLLIKDLQSGKLSSDDAKIIEDKIRFILNREDAELFTELFKRGLMKVTPEKKAAVEKLLDQLQAQIIEKGYQGVIFLEVDNCIVIGANNSLPITILAPMLLNIRDALLSFIKRVGIRDARQADLDSVKQTVESRMN